MFTVMFVMRNDDQNVVIGKLEYEDEFECNFKNI